MIEHKRISSYYVLVPAVFGPAVVREFSDRHQALIYMTLFRSASLIYGSVLKGSNNIIVKEVSANS